MDYLSEAHLHPDIARGRRMASAGPALKPKRRYLTRDLVGALVVSFLTGAGAAIAYALSGGPF